ncbi:hypothetical protein F4694_004098 [Bacillus niacini]|uniref:Uncharacterized protein n=1 Tax=Neobacillus niacini TaxID=86668 RepID=A0A852TET7_9BACI|nr:hypothetical protein [Neobacillus niacini]NYE07313.1 hypothetical protein [Neobacillus niacini]
MEIKKTKFIRRSELTQSKTFKRFRVLRLRKEVFKSISKTGNTTVMVHSELWRLTSEELRQWIKEETEKGNPVLKNIRRAIQNCYRDD